MVSVIITAYNYDRYIERAIRSAMNQSVDDKQFEIILVNDASTDRTLEILENYKDDIRVFNFKENKGLAAARNFGVRKAKGQFVVFLDADDFIHSELLKIQLFFLEQNSKLDAVAVDYYLVDERGDKIEHVSAVEKPIACGVMFRKDLLFDIGLYDENFKAREEEDLRIRFLKEFNIYNIILPLYRYRMHDSNLTKNSEVMEEYQNQLNQKHQRSNED